MEEVKQVYCVESSPLYNLYSLTVYDVKRETPKQYKVENPHVVIGSRPFHSVLSKDDAGVFTDFDAAIESIKSVIQRFIEKNESRNAQMQNNIQFLGKLTHDNWEDVLGSMTRGDYGQE